MPMSKGRSIGRLRKFSKKDCFLKVDKTILETERLILREFSTSDAEFILILLNTPSWLKFIGDKKIHSIDDAKRYLIDGPLKSYRENGFGLWLVLLKESNISVGMCGLIKRDYMDDIDICFALTHIMQ